MDKYDVGLSSPPVKDIRGTETWMPVAGFAHYEVSSMGSVRRTSKPSNRHTAKEKLAPQMRGKGYFAVRLYTSGGDYTICSVHRLVAINFLPKPETADFVNHKNGIKTDNRLENLEWVTAKENTAHSMSVLGKNRGSKWGWLN